MTQGGHSGNLQCLGCQEKRFDALHALHHDEYLVTLHLYNLSVSKIELFTPSLHAKPTNVNSLAAAWQSKFWNGESNERMAISIALYQPGLCDRTAK